MNWLLLKPEVFGFKVQRFQGHGHITLELMARFLLAQMSLRQNLSLNPKP